jgi:hypothetical protein
MAVVTPTKVEGPGSVVVYTWVLAASDTGAPVIVPDKADKTVQLFGTFGAAVTMQGSNETGTPTTWATLTDPQGNAIAPTAAALEAIAENPYQIRPSAGAVTSVTVALCCH